MLGGGQRSVYNSIIVETEKQQQVTVIPALLTQAFGY